MNYKLHYTLLLFALICATSAYSEQSAYSVNSDSGDIETQDSLYKINLETGEDERIGELISGAENRLDTEGLAMSSDGELWGIDDDSRTLFPINKSSGGINFLEEVPLPGMPAGGGNDFGLTFGCDNTLYVTSVLTQSLYRLNGDGSIEVIGSEGALGVNISAIAALDDINLLYGLGNGQFQNGGMDSPNLYSISTQTGVATLIGPLGAQAGEYAQAGLAFDPQGMLWAITDRRIVNNTIVDSPSQILQVDIETGKATMVSHTTQVGYESLVIAPAVVCNDMGPDDSYLPRIPTMNNTGRMLVIMMILFAGMLGLRKHRS